MRAFLTITTLLIAALAVTGVASSHERQEIAGMLFEVYRHAQFQEAGKRREPNLDALFPCSTEKVHRDSVKE